MVIWEKIDKTGENIRKIKYEILTFHRITEQRNNYFIPAMALSKKTFEQFVGMLGKCKKTESVEGIIQRKMKGENYSNLVALTFDDGYRDNYLIARDILLRLGIPATFYIPIKQINTNRVFWWDYLFYIIKNHISAFLFWANEENSLKEILLRFKIETGGTGKNLSILITRSLVHQFNRLGFLQRESILKDIENEFGPYEGERLLMNWSEISQLKKDGFYIGSHSVSHQPLTDLTWEDANKEIVHSKKMLSEKLNCNIDGFSYPRGKWDTSLASAVKDAGYSYAVTTHYGSNLASHNQFSLFRRNIDEFTDIRKHFSISTYMLELTGLLDVFLSKRRNNKS